MSFITFILLFLTCFLQSINAFCPLFLKNQTVCTCSDYIDGAIIKCRGSQGPLIVEELKKIQLEVRELSLENANIVEIGPRAFKNLRIKKLNLDNNKIVSIQKDAFRGLESVLQELSINHNRLTEIPTDALENLRALNVLSLSCNEIKNLTDVVFQNMPSLIEVNLACNKICKINKVSFSEVKNTLQNIILDNNCLRHVPTQAIENMQFLIALHLKYNKIEKLGKNDLQNLTSLLILRLTGNNISHISKKFIENVPNLRYIYLNENSLTSIDAETIKQFSEAEIIDLSYNNLPEITVDMFSGMKNLQHLNLEANAIKDVAPGAFSTTPLFLLWLPHNCLNSISPNIFQGTPFLKQVSLAHNNIRSIQPFSFAHLANLHTLDLSYNKIQTIQQSSIMGSDFLTVRMQENPLVCNQDGFHVMNGREAINLTTEANLICQTDYLQNVLDKCPRRLERPARPACCKSLIKNKVTTATPSFSVTQTHKITDKKKKDKKKISFNSMQPTVNESRAAKRARKLNLERFLRLQQRPTDLTAVPHNKTPFDSIKSVNKIFSSSNSAEEKKKFEVYAKDLSQLNKKKIVDERYVSPRITKPTYDILKEPTEIDATKTSNVQEFNHDVEFQNVIKNEEIQFAKKS